MPPNLPDVTTNVIHLTGSLNPDHQTVREVMK